MWECEGSGAIDVGVGTCVEGADQTPKCEHFVGQKSIDLHDPVDVGGANAGATRRGELIKKAEDSETVFAAAMAADPSSAVQTWWSARSAADKHRDYLCFFGMRALINATKTAMDAP